MSELSQIVAHYLEAIVKRAGLKGFDELRVEIEAAAEADERQLAARVVEAVKRAQR